MKEILELIRKVCSFFSLSSVASYAEVYTSFLWEKYLLFFRKYNIIHDGGDTLIGYFLFSFFRKLVYIVLLILGICIYAHVYGVDLTHGNSVTKLISIIMLCSILLFLPLFVWTLLAIYKINTYYAHWATIMGALTTFSYILTGFYFLFQGILHFYMFEKDLVDIIPPSLEGVLTMFNIQVLAPLLCLFFFILVPCFVYIAYPTIHFGTFNGSPYDAEYSYKFPHAIFSLYFVLTMSCHIPFFRYMYSFDDTWFTLHLYVITQLLLLFIFSSILFNIDRTITWFRNIILCIIIYTLMIYIYFDMVLLLSDFIEEILAIFSVCFYYVFEVFIDLAQKHVIINLLFDLFRLFLYEFFFIWDYFSKPEFNFLFSIVFFCIHFVCICLLFIMCSFYAWLFIYYIYDEYDFTSFLYMLLFILLCFGLILLFLVWILILRT